MTDPRRELEDILGDIVRTLDGLDLEAQESEHRLEEVHPFQSPGMARIRELCVDGVNDEWLVPREAGPGVRFGRLSKDLGGWTVDAVLLSASGLGHRHPTGEVTVAFAWDGEEPRFDGRKEGWIVMPPDSHHVPTVEGGTMLVVYFTRGDVVWDA